MFELVKVGEHTYYMDCPARVGFYVYEENKVVVIDSGHDKDAGKRVKRHLDANGWQLTAIFNTHSHADHIGGCQYLQNQTGCKIYSPGVEAAMTEYPILEPMILFGGNPTEEMHNKFLMAKESRAEKISEEVLPEGLEVLDLRGHSYNQVGFRTKDNVIFLGDSLSSEVTLQKYQIGYIFDIAAYLETLGKILELEADLFVPAHAEPEKDIRPLAQLNIGKTMEIAETICEILETPKTMDDLLADVFTQYGLVMNLQQNLLIGSTVRSYLTYLTQQRKITYDFENNRMYWRKLTDKEA